MAEQPAQPTTDTTPAIKAGDAVWVLGKVLAAPDGDPPEIKPGFQIRFASTIPLGATVVVLPRDIVRAMPGLACLTKQLNERS